MVFTLEPLPNLDYQQRHTYNGLEIASDGSLEPLHMTFFAVVIPFSE
jgi:hypothetical protein